MNYNRTGKVLSLVLINTQDLLIEVERDKGSFSLCAICSLYILLLYMQYI